MGNRARLSIFGYLLLISACQKAKPPAPPPPTVQVVEVVQKDVPIYREWVGSLDGFTNADIKPQVTGYVRKQVYREGASVHTGDVLFLIDPRNYKEALDAARATLQSNIAALTRARLDVQRDKELIAAEAITRQQFDHDLATEREASAAVDQARANLNQAELNRGWTEVTSLIDGIAGIAQVQVGNLVNTSTTMTTVSLVDPIKAQLNISESEYLQSMQGNHWAEPARGDDPRLQLILENGTAYPHPGTVVIVNRQFNPQTGTIAIQGSFPNPGNLLRPGQYAKIRAVIAVRQNARLVPQRAVTELQGTYQVGVVDPDGKFDLRAVKTAEQIGTSWVVTEGVNAGDKVVVSSLARLRPGITVHAVPAEAGSTASQETASDNAAQPAPPPGSSSSRNR
jgi:membrane fusion protein, multidrug efflux system